MGKRKEEEGMKTSLKKWLGKKAGRKDFFFADGGGTLRKKGVKEAGDTSKSAIGPPVDP